MRWFWHVLYVFSVLSTRINLILFHERSASHGISLEYHQQGNRSNLKINFFRLRGGLEGGQGYFVFGRKKICFFWYVLDVVFPVLSDRIKPISFHERSASHGTINRVIGATWKSTFLDLGGSWGESTGNFLGKQIMFWISWNYRWPNETLAELIWDKKLGMTQPKAFY